MKILILILVLFIAFTFSVAAQTPCPTISVSGPSGITPIGESMTFTAKVEGYDLDKIKYEWTINDALTFNGQGTATITVATNAEMYGMTVTATVKISEFPQNCSNSASGSAEIEYDESIGDPRILDDYEKIPWRKEKEKLNNLITELNTDDEAILYFVVRTKGKNSSQIFKTHSAKIEKCLTKTLKIPKERFKFIREKDGEFQVTICLKPKDLSPPL